VRNKTIHVVIGLNIDGYKEVVVIWLQILIQLKYKEINKIFIACVDGLIEFPDALKAVFSQTKV